MKRICADDIGYQRLLTKSPPLVARRIRTARRIALSCVMILVSVALSSFAGSLFGQRPSTTDLYGDPLPRGALLRLGTVRYRTGEKVNTLAYSQDGKYLVADSGIFGPEIRVWDSQTGTPVHRCKLKWRSPTVSVRHLNRMIVTGPLEGSEEEGLYVRDLATGKMFYRVAGGPLAHSLALAPNEALLAWANNSARITLWDMSSNRLKATIDYQDVAEEGVPDFLGFTPAGRSLFLGYREPAAIHLWNIDSLQHQTTLVHKDFPIGNVQFSSDGNWLAALGDWRSRAIVLWNLNTSEKVLLNTAQVSDGQAFLGIAFSPVQPLLAIGCDEKLVLWDLNTREVARTMLARGMSPADLAFSPDGQYLAHGQNSFFGEENTLYVWDVKAGHPRVQPVGHTTAIEDISLSRSGNTAAALDLHGVARWDLDSGKRIDLKPFGNDKSPIALAPTGDALIVRNTATKQLYFWDLTSNSQPRALDLPKTEEDRAYFEWARGVLSENKRFLVIAIPENDRFPVSSDAKEIVLWNLSTKSRVSHKREADTRICFVFREEANPWVAVSRKNIVEIKDLFANSDVRRFSVEGASVLHMAFSPNARYLAAYVLTADNRVRIMVWDTEASRLVENSETSSFGELRLAFSPDGKRLLLREGTMIELESGRTLRCFVTGWTEIDEPAFSNDGEYLAMTDGEGIHIVEANSGLRLFVLSGHLGRVNKLVFSADNRRLLSASGDTTALVWDLHTQIEQRQSQVKDMDLAKEEQNIQEMVVRYMIGVTLPDWNHSTEGQVAFLANDWTSPMIMEVTPDGRGRVSVSDPEPSFLLRFKDDTHPIRKASEATITQSPFKIVDSRSGKEGFAIKVPRVKWISHTEVVAYAIDLQPYIDFQGWYFHLLFENATWRIVKHGESLEWYP